MTTFSSLGLAEPILRALKEEGYETPTPIQAQAIPELLTGRDLLGIAQTGTGKTAAFALPILHRLNAAKRNRKPRSARVLVLAPTRELAAQIGDNFEKYGRHMGVRVAVIVGGVRPGPQVRAMAPGVDVLVATPGRLLDHIGERAVSIADTEVVVLDEADHMLDLGFIVPLRRIIKHLPAKRQNLFFSATMPKEIGALAGDMLHEPAKVSVTPVATTAEKVRQRVIFVETNRKRALLADLLADKSWQRTIVFTRTKRGADRVAKSLVAAGIEAAAIHGDKSQNQRERALESFKTGGVRALIATDIAARGIDVDGVTHVVNFDLPEVPEAYVHRIGRTARAGNAGEAVAFCADDERGLLKDIERTTRQSIPSEDRRDAAAAAAMAEAEPERRQSAGRGGRGRAGQAPSSGRRDGGRSAGRSDGRREGSRSGGGRGQGNARPADQRGQPSRGAGDRRQTPTPQGANENTAGLARLLGAAPRPHSDEREDRGQREGGRDGQQRRRRRRTA
ncbi:DEAD/DEAH box helicase [Pseudokordiimonas caeni]|uniref:DEAD/DEAH box helicase n=1 Tax=Pseudokordiimonas caeni TaxID=2997908 RepID=UPI00281136F8|nr:DEAD/DEAH box helicase [Pseudokordiimonas caeni]